MEKPKIFFDMDGVLADVKSALEAREKLRRRKSRWRYEECWGIYELMQPTKGAKIAVAELAKYYDLFVLSSASWKNDSAWAEKVDWIKRRFGGEGLENPFHKKVILTTRKDLVFSPGSWLIDDRYDSKAGSGDFIGRKIWLRLPRNDRAYCETRYENDVEECRSWYDVLQRLLTIQQGDDSWTQYEDELSDSSNTIIP